MAEPAWCPTRWALATAASPPAGQDGESGGRAGRRTCAPRGTSEMDKPRLPRARPPDAVTAPRPSEQSQCAGPWLLDDVLKGLLSLCTGRAVCTLGRPTRGAGCGPSLGKVGGRWPRSLRGSQACPSLVPSESLPASGLPYHFIIKKILDSSPFISLPRTDHSKGKNGTPH